MDARKIKKALRQNRLLVRTFDPSGAVYSLDNGVPVSRKLAVELTAPSKLQGDLFLRANEDGLWPGYTQTWRAEG